MKGNRAKEVLELVHTDVCGPMSTEARGGFRYFITFIDDYSKVGYVYLMRFKCESLTSSKNLRLMRRRVMENVSKACDLIAEANTSVPSFWTTHR